MINIKRLIFTLLLLMPVVACEIKTFTAHEGGKVEIQCPYESNYEDKMKYICRGDCPLYDKDIPVKSGSPAEDKRFSLTDNRTAHIFTITITDLRTEDAGKYWCAVKTGFGQLDYYIVNYLKVKSVSRVSGVTGQRQKITCHYERDMKDIVKFICKGSEPSFCKSMIKVSSEKSNNGRFSLRDDISERVLTVNVTNLTEEDSGIYWCGVVNKQEYTWISAISLKISPAPSERTPPKETTSASFDTSTPADSTSSRAVTSSLYSSSTTSTFFSDAKTSSSETQPVSVLQGITTVIMGLSIVMLTGFGLSLFLYFRWKRKKKEAQMSTDVVRGPTVNLDNRRMVTTREAANAVSVYEEINDHPVYSLVSPEPDASVYALAELPSSPSDDLNYSTIKFSAVRQSERTCDGLDTCVYSTVGL